LVRRRGPEPRSARGASSVVGRAGSAASVARRWRRVHCAVLRRGTSRSPRIPPPPSSRGARAGPACVSHVADALLLSSPCRLLAGGDRRIHGGSGQRSHAPSRDSVGGEPHAEAHSGARRLRSKPGASRSIGSTICRPTWLPHRGQTAWPAARAPALKDA
jgi:hypothetical protein